EETLESDEVRRAASMVPERSTSQLNMPITILQLPAAIIHLLQRKGIFLIEQLIKFRGKHYEGDREIGITQSTEIDRALKLFLKRSDDLDASQAATRQDHETNQSHQIPLTTDLKVALDSLWLDDYTWSAIELRALRLLFLREIGVELGGKSKEIVRRLLDHINEKIQSRLSLISGFCDYFEDRARLIRDELSTEELALPVLIGRLERELSGSNFVATQEDLRRLIAMIRLLAMSGKFWVRDHFEAKWKDFTFLVCLAGPPIEQHEAVHQFLVERRGEKEQRTDYKDLAYSVLAEAQTALHWTDIAEKARKLHKREKFAARSLYSVLHYHRDIFVRVGQGTYELAEWGGKEVSPYPEILASVMKQENHAMPVDSLFARVSSMRPITQQSLGMYLEMHPRFYKAINNTYGLRGWLPPKDKHDPHAPEWLSETSTSLRRVERSKARGHDVDRMIAGDKLN
ncbi:MAG TPA: HTH domain-containing protein, partial [Anaerolineales bacterium]|nr:HTH domain-containing protein [Anaerolineales bacterium]